MNPRILKKLTKKADRFVAGRPHFGERVVVTSLDRETIDTNQKVDRKHLDRWSGRPNRYGYFTPLKGTVIYGGMVGYYEPEWEELDAYSILVGIVTDHFTDYSECDGESWPKPKIKLSTPARVFSAAASL